MWASESRECFLSIFLFILQFSLSSSFAYWMENGYCDRSVTPGSVIMNEKAVLSVDGRIRVFRGKNFDIELYSGFDLYSSAEKLRVWLQLDNGEGESESVIVGDEDVIFEVMGVGGGGQDGFRAGGCSGRRTARQGSILQVPQFEDTFEEDDGQALYIWAGWASSHGVVRVSEVFSLLPCTDRNMNFAMLRHGGYMEPASPVTHAHLHPAAAAAAAADHSVNIARVGGITGSASAFAGGGSARTKKSDNSNSNITSRMRMHSLRGRVAGFAAQAKGSTVVRAPKSVSERNSFISDVGVWHLSPLLVMLAIAIAFIVYQRWKKSLHFDRKRHI